MREYRRSQIGYWGRDPSRPRPHPRITFQVPDMDPMTEDPDGDPKYRCGGRTAGVHRRTKNFDPSTRVYEHKRSSRICRGETLNGKERGRYI